MTDKLRLTMLVVAGLLSLVTAQAQTDGYNPSNPADPLMKTKVKCASEPSNAGYTSGGGSYISGTTVTISTSAKSSSWDFAYWTLDGKKYTESRTFTYTTTRSEAVFKAVYNYNPNDPSDPQTDHNYHLNLASTPAAACSFNMTSGARHRSGTSVTVSAFPNQYYTLTGWYLDGEKMSDKTSYTFTMPEKSITLTATFSYNFVPVSPDDPSGSQTGVDNTLRGDVNGDGVVDVSDASAVVSKVVGSVPAKFIDKAADYNVDKTIDVSDASAIVTYVVAK